MPCAGGMFFERRSLLVLSPCAGGGTGDQLWPQAPCAGPLARWHKPQLALAVKIDSSPHGIARTGGVSRNMRKSPCGTFFGSLREQRSKRAYHGRADVKRKMKVRHRAHEEIQTHMPPEPYDRKSFGLYPYYPALLYSERDTKKYSPPTHICAFRSRP